jgi:Fe-S-cluster-containing hydrogenase component 2
MKRNWPWNRPNATSFVTVNAKLCAACWDCVGVCPRGVLGRVVFLWHRHVRVDQPEACTGCQNCVRACKQGALTAVARALVTSLDRSPDNAGAA